MEEIRCRICDNTLTVVGRFGRRVCGPMPPGSSQVQLEDDGDSHYFMCPYCSARNVTIVTTGRSGRPAMQVAWAVMNGG